MSVKELDVVLLSDGREGTIIDIYDGGKAFLIEVCDSNGKTLDMPTVDISDIKKILFVA